MSLIIKHIKQLIQVEENPVSFKKGKSMQELHCLEDAWLKIKNDRISGFGLMKDCHEDADKVINAKGKMVFPAWCDSHTHIVYAGSRESEFVDRINGLSYEEIAERGGGILNSAKKLRATAEEDLLEQAYHRIEEIKEYGTGAVEIKSGYGLSEESELKMLRVIKKLKSISPLKVKRTFLGAHAIPLEYKNDRSAYIKKLTNRMIPQIAEEQLADYCDVFCDRGFFTPEETDKILKAGLKYGLKPKIHANELDYSGGIEVGVKNKAISVDHLEFTGIDQIACLLDSDTMPTLLPSTAFFLNLPFAPARKMIDSGLPIALATDYNPGSTPSGRMSFVLSLACIKMKMTPEEAINAATINGAKAMEIEKDYGSIAVGKKANVWISKKMPSLAYLSCSFGSDLVETVIINGIIQ